MLFNHIRGTHDNDTMEGQVTLTQLDVMWSSVSLQTGSAVSERRSDATLRRGALILRHIGVRRGVSKGMEDSRRPFPGG
jgi:hypothetical protein